ncbi:FtsX-like permease family protein [Kitasatospora kifunensis]|uniref:Putative ABC transport system permease protein n=1 Tax=Kitasatospora kifunensis TaxID=58351 RepID=A0A7W7R6A1_KITKI|nr:FtsX-like permease family protein [Kitasatospora kifunensis]MBB4926197.1 putative ABC transport system permease protein [Kitasatospora kifunensis]
MNLTSFRLALRIARRDALRAKGRSALIVAMVALPVLGVAGADVVYRSAQLNPSERVARTMGTSDALITAYAMGSTVQQRPFADDGVRTVQQRADQSPTPEQLRGATTDPAKLATSLLPPGSVLSTARSGPQASASSREGLLSTATAEADLTGSLWSGKLNVVKGHAPNAPFQLAATQAFLDQSGLSLGDTTTLKGLEKQPYTLTAVVEYPGDLSQVAVIGRPGELIEPLKSVQPPSQDADQQPTSSGSAGSAGSAGSSGAGSSGAGSAASVSSDAPAWLVRLPAGATLDWNKVQELNRYGFTVTSRSVALDPPPRSAVPYDRFIVEFGPTSHSATIVVLVTVAGMALLETVLLAGPAFAVGARRSRRQLALLAAGGGDRSQVGAVVLGSGVVLGAAGAVTGTVLSIGLVAVLRPWIEQTAGSRFGHFNLRPVDLLAVAAVGLVTALLAAVLPAVQAARQDVVLSLNGRATAKPASRRLAVLGVVLVIAGAVTALFGAGSGQSNRLVIGSYDMQTLTVLGGSVTAELGMLACTPLLVSQLGRLGRWLPLSPRIALRDSARYRGRTAPAIAAVMAAVAGAVAVSVYTTSTDAQDKALYRATAPSGAVTLSVMRDSQMVPRLRSAVEQQLPELGQRADISQALYIFCAQCSSVVYFKPTVPTPGGDLYRSSSRVLVGDATALHNLFALHDPAAEAALAAGKAVVFDPTYVKDGKATFALQGALGAPVQPGQTPEPSSREVSVDAVLVDNPADARYGTGLVSPDLVQRLGLVTQPSMSVWLPATVPTAKNQQRAAGAVNQTDPSADLSVERGYQSKSDLVTLALTGFAALVVLGAAGIATGLAAADSRPDQATLAAVGAPPRIRRTLSGLQCGLIAVVGAALGTVCGFVPAVALRRARDLAFYGSSDLHSPISVPWTLILVTVLILPLAAALVAAATTRSRVQLDRRAT